MSKYEIEEVITEPTNTQQVKNNDIIMQPEELPVLPSPEAEKEEKEEIEENDFVPLTENITTELNEEPCIKHKLFGTLKDRNICHSSNYIQSQKKNNNIGTYLIIGSLIATIGSKFI